MEYETLGGTGMRVSRLCLGTMMFGAWGNADREECTRIVRAGLDAGINFLDTANVYSAGESEEIVGGALRSLGVDRDDVVLATKCHAHTGEGPNAVAAEPAVRLRAWEYPEIRHPHDHGT